MSDGLIFSHRMIHLLLLTGNLNEPRRKDGDETRLITRGDVPLLASMYRNEEVYHQRLDKGYQAVVCIRAGEVIHMEWFCSVPYYIWDGRVVFDPGQGGYYLFDLYTRPDCRGSGIWRLAIREIIDRVQDKNTHPSLFTAVDYRNPFALKVHLQNGFSHMGLLEFKQVFGFRKWILRRGADKAPSCEWGMAGLNTARLLCSAESIRLVRGRGR